MTIFNPENEQRCARCGQWWITTRVCHDRIDRVSQSVRNETVNDLIAKRDALRAEVERLRVKAAAFDWLKDEHDRIDPMVRCVVTRTLIRGSGDWVDFTNGDSFARVVLRESSVDAARAAQEGGT